MRSKVDHQCPPWYGKIAGLKFHNLHFCNNKKEHQAPAGAVVINVTSVSRDFGQALSPMLNDGPIEVGGLTALTVENIWQYTKVYKEHLGKFAEWKAWRDAGFANHRGVRYPMGKGSKPEFSYLNKETGKLGYIEARKAIYIPAYQQKLDRYCVRQVNTIIDMLTCTDVWIWDFDVREPNGKTFQDLAEDPSAPLGHGFVLAKYISNMILAETGIETFK